MAFKLFNTGQLLAWIVSKLRAQERGDPGRNTQRGGRDRRRGFPRDLAKPHGVQYPVKVAGRLTADVQLDDDPCLPPSTIALLSLFHRLLQFLPQPIFGGGHYPNVAAFFSTQKRM
jgi:hypothetical protein